MPGNTLLRVDTYSCRNSGVCASQRFAVHLVKDSGPRYLNQLDVVVATPDKISGLSSQFDSLYEGDLVQLDNVGKALGRYTQEFEKLTEKE